jgi:hypothetical protein
MKPCRDCGVPTAPSARSCPSCGILNPVMQWVALPNGEHLTAREPVRPGGASAALAVPAPFARIATPAPALAKAKDTFGEDRLASWAIWAVVFAILSITVVGGAVGGLIAGVISLPIGAMLPTRADGRKIPVWLSAILIGVAFIILAGPLVLLLLAAAAA